MTPNQALWEKGDFTKLAALMRQSGEALGTAIPANFLRLTVQL